MHEKFMTEAIKEANKSLEINEVPVGAVIVKNGKIISRGHNIKEKKQSSLAHAEIIAIEKATRKVKNWRLIDCDIYVTLEPCPMCTSAIKQSRIKKVYYGAESTDNNNHKIFQDICNSSDNNDKINYYHNNNSPQVTQIAIEFLIIKNFYLC